MRAVRFYQFGEPDEVVRVEEIAKPDPAAGEVLVRFTARPVSPSSLLFLRGKYGVQPPLPAIPGTEGAGVVERITQGCTRFRPGDRVAVVPGALGADGTWREFAAIFEDKLIPTPEPLSDAQASTAWANYLTAWLMVTRTVRLEPGDIIIATALGSHIGRAFLEIARLRGFRVIGTVRASELVSELQALGASAVATSAAELRAFVGDGTRARGVRAVFDAVGGELGTAAFRCLADDGHFVGYGMLSHQPVEVDSAALVFRRQQVSGFWLSYWILSSPWRDLLAAVSELTPYFARGIFRPAIDSEFPLEDVRDAIRHAARSGRHGKVVLVGT